MHSAPAEVSLARMRSAFHDHPDSA